MTPPEPEVLTALVERILRIEDITTGDAESKFVARYRGRLRIDSIEAYDQLSDAVAPYKLTPLFRIDEEDGSHLVYLMPGVISPEIGNIKLTIALLIFTIISVMMAGMTLNEPLPPDLPGAILAIARNILSGWPFALALMSILLAHEFGHYLVGRRNKTPVTLPYFIPLPFVGLLGTMGAFINMKAPPRNRRALFDIGIAGPLAGLAVAIPVLIIGLSLSGVSTLQDLAHPTRAIAANFCPEPAPVTGGYTCPGDNLLEGNSLLYLGLKYLVKGQLLPAPPAYDGPPLFYWLRYYFTGSPLPIGGQDVILHPVALAGWAGLLVTALNLIPAGQLDGGHIAYVLLGKRVRSFFWVVIAILGVLGLFWSGWWLWAFILFFLGRGHADPLDTITQLDSRRRLVGWLMIGVFVLVFIPVPFVTF